MAVGLHPLRGGDVLGVVDLAGPTEPASRRSTSWSASASPAWLVIN
jgi:hypothetical protein